MIGWIVSMNFQEIDVVIATQIHNLDLFRKAFKSVINSSVNVFKSVVLYDGIRYILPITNLLYLQIFHQTSMTSDSQTLEVSVILLSKFSFV